MQTLEGGDKSLEHDVIKKGCQGMDLEECVERNMDTVTG